MRSDIVRMRYLAAFSILQGAAIANLAPLGRIESFVNALVAHAYQSLIEIVSFSTGSFPMPSTEPSGQATLSLLTASQSVLHNLLRTFVLTGTKNRPTSP